jgi:hypothetical protein
MNLLQDIITYVRRIVKTPSNASLSDNLIIDYINRFWLMDMDARMQLFDFKTTYRFQSSPGIDQYNMPLYNTNGYPTQIEPGNQLISYYPVYQGFLGPAFVNGIQVPLFSDQGGFFNIWPNYIQALNNSFFGDGTDTYTLSTPFFPALAGHVDISGIIAANSNIDPIVSTTLNTSVPKTSTYPAVFITTLDADNNTIVASDSGQFLQSSGVIGNMQLGMLTGNVAPVYSSTNNVVNYTNGQIRVQFDRVIPAGNPINIQSYFIQQGIPRAILYYNNTLTIRPPPDVSYLIELEAYLTPAAFLSTSQSVPFAYMSEYVSRGAARKILSDTGDMEQFMFYEPLFKEQETLVWKRSQRQFTSTRTPTIFSEFSSQSPSNNFSGGGN